ncbi:tetratricopeptide repeat protein [Lacinutrix salivirga]
MNTEELLSLYFSNGLTPSQEDLFNDLLEKDAEFKSQFEFEKNLKRVIKDKESEAFKAKLQSFEAEHKTVNKPGFNWRIAASIIFFLGAGYFGYQSFFGVDYNELYETNYATYPNTLYPITRSDTINSIERQAFVAYEAEDYETALINFEKIEAENKTADHNFYKAQTYLQLNDLDKAEKLLNNLMNSKSQFKAEATWYLALIELKKGNKTEAKSYLKTLIIDYNYKKKEAKALLNALS